jgi:hypothetical protein
MVTQPQKTQFLPIVKKLNQIKLVLLPVQLKLTWNLNLEAIKEQLINL